MISKTSKVKTPQFERASGWAIKPEGACRDDRCVQLPQQMSDVVDFGVIAELLNMPLIHDESVGLWCLGPEAGGKALPSVEAPELDLPDWRGNTVRVSDLRGRKVLLLVWAPW